MVEVHTRYQAWRKSSDLRRQSPLTRGPPGHCTKTITETTTLSDFVAQTESENLTAARTFTLSTRYPPLQISVAVRCMEHAENSAPARVCIHVGCTDIEAQNDECIDN